MGILSHTIRRPKRFKERYLTAAAILFSTQPYCTIPYCVCLCFEKHRKTQKYHNILFCLFVCFYLLYVLIGYSKRVFWQLQIGILPYLLYPFMEVMLDRFGKEQKKNKDKLLYLFFFARGKSKQRRSVPIPFFIVFLMPYTSAWRVTDEETADH